MFVPLTPWLGGSFGDHPWKNDRVLENQEWVVVWGGSLSYASAEVGASRFLGKSLGSVMGERLASAHKGAA